MAEEPTEQAEEAAPTAEDWRPHCRLRTVLSRMSSSRRFGRQMQRERKRRRLYEALTKAFVGDGLAWNWSIRNEFFPDFTAVLDFIHPLSYPQRCKNAA